MVDNATLHEWFRREVLPLEPSLTNFIRRNWRTADDVPDLRHDVYELAISSAKTVLPDNTSAFMFAIARNHLINCSKRARIIPFDLVADTDLMSYDRDRFDTDRHLSARDALRQAQDGLEKLSPRVREIVRLRKVEGLNTRETAERLGIGIDAVKQQLSMGMQALTDFMLGGSGKIIRPKFIRSGNKRGEP